MNLVKKDHPKVIMAAMARRLEVNRRKTYYCKKAELYWEGRLREKSSAAISERGVPR